MADSQFEHSQWNFTSADAAALDMMGVWPLHESNPFLQDLLQTREASTHLTDDVHTFGLSHDAAFYHSVVTSILDRFRFVFVQYNPSARGGERRCLRATQCDHPGCMALLRAGLLPISVNVANITRLLPSANSTPWLVASAGDAHAASASEISVAVKKIVDWANVGAPFRLLEELTQDNFALLTHSRPIVIFFTGVADSHNVAIKRVLRAAAAKFLTRVRFGHLNGLRYHGLALKMGVDYPAPSIILIDNAKHFSAVTTLSLNFLCFSYVFNVLMPNFQVFPRHEAVSLATLESWLSAYLAGNLMPTFRSGPGADDKWLQASEWREQIQQNSQSMKFTLVAFTARWCGFCKGVPPLIKVIDKVKSFVHLVRFNILTISKILSQEALPVAVKLFDVDINDAAVASSLVNVTTIPTLILIPPLPSDGAASHGSSTMYGSVFPCTFASVDINCTIVLNFLDSYTGPLAVQECLDFVRKQVMQLLERHQQ